MVNFLPLDNYSMLELSLTNKVNILLKKKKKKQMSIICEMLY